MLPGMTEREAFTVHGRDEQGRSVAISWTAYAGFNDPTGRIAAMIAEGVEVCATVTGPCFTAAAEPGHVAMLTAVQALAEVVTVDGGETFVAELQRLSALPVGASGGPRR